jgi:hypothetical protein
MTRQTHVEAGCRSVVLWSPCGAYRYELTRRWGDGGRLVWVLLNPSAADHLRNDATLARCERRARAMGFGALRVVNLFALRSRDPRLLRSAADPQGPDNDAAIRRAARWADMAICGWGNAGTLEGRAAAVLSLLRKTGLPLYHLGRTASGQPRHPLYVGTATSPTPWPEEDGA